jgi:hypothetical protein
MLNAVRREKPQRREVRCIPARGAMRGFRYSGPAAVPSRWEPTRRATAQIAAAMSSTGATKMPPGTTNVTINAASSTKPMMKGMDVM